MFSTKDERQKKRSWFHCYIFACESTTIVAKTCSSTSFGATHRGSYKHIVYGDPHIDCVWEPAAGRWEGSATFTGHINALTPPIFPQDMQFRASGGSEEVQRGSTHTALQLRLGFAPSEAGHINTLAPPRVSQALRPGGRTM